jgi:hypothetical protein
MPQRKNPDTRRVEPAEQVDNAGIYPLARRSSAAPVHHGIQSIMFQPPANSSHLALLDPDTLRRLHPAQPLRDSFSDHFLPGHNSRLPLHPPLDLLYRHYRSGR